MKLVPIRPPGPNARKARTYATDILRLRDQGYTFEAIREALAAADIHVSNSTVQREVARARRQLPVTYSNETVRRDQSRESHTARFDATARPMGREGLAKPDPSPSPTNPGQSSFANGPSGEDVAKAFMSTQITNPFLREKEQR